MIWWFHLVIKSSWNILSSIVHQSSKQIENASSDRLKGVTTATRLAQLGEHRSAEREVVGSNPGRTDNQGLFLEKKSGEIMLTAIWDLVSVKVIASLGSDVKPLALSPSSFFQQSKSKGTKKNPHYCSKESGKFSRWCGLPFTHHSYHGLWVGYNKLINGLIAAAGVALYTEVRAHC